MHIYYEINVHKGRSLGLEVGAFA